MGLVFSQLSFTSWGEGATLILAGNPFSDSVTTKIPQMFYYIDHPHTPFFPIGLVKTETDFIVASVETGLVR